MSYPELKLSNQVCFLVHRLDQVINGHYRPLLDKLGLTYTQYVAMMVLWEHKELTIGTLCNQLGSDTGTISPLAKRLEQAGYITRSRKNKDERTVYLTVTPKGWELELAAKEVPHKLTACFGSDPQEYLAMHQYLTQMLDRIQNMEKCS